MDLWRSAFLSKGAGYMQGYMDDRQLPLQSVYYCSYLILTTFHHFSLAILCLLYRSINLQIYNFCLSTYLSVLSYLSIYQSQCIHIYLSISVFRYISLCLYIYTYIYRERETDRQTDRQTDVCVCVRARWDLPIDLSMTHYC